MAEPSRAIREFARRVEGGRFDLQQCSACGRAQWPPREICSACLSDNLQWTKANPASVVIAATTLHVSHEEFFSARLPWRVGLVKLDAGPVAYAHLHENAEEGARVVIEAHLDFAGRPVLIALPEGVAVKSDGKLAELTAR